MDNEYFSRYNKLREMVKACYVDYYILQEIKNFAEKFNKTENHFNCYLKIINHHCRLTKEHLALTLWKLTDTQNKSNTIVTLSTYLRKIYNKSADTLSKENRNYRDEQLTPIRRKMLAHNDIENSGVELNVDELFKYLVDVKNALNRLCFETIDNRAKPLSDTEIFSIGGNYQIRQHLLYSHLLEYDASNSN